MVLFVVMDVTGNKYGKWLVTDGSIPPFGGTDIHKVLCRCDCGTVRKVRFGNLRQGLSKSCGCYRRPHKGNFKHGHSGQYGTHSGTYGSWASMISRCNYPKDIAYNLYGGRGIRVCDRWRNDFRKFLSDMGERPNGHSLDRLDNDGDYTPENCRWATTKEQQRNRRNNITVIYDGVEMCLAQFAEKINMDYETVRRRFKAGWSLEKIETTPNRTKIIEFKGETMNLSDFARRIGMKQQTVSARMLRGWTPEKIAATPIKG